MRLKCKIGSVRHVGPCLSSGILCYFWREMRGWAPTSPSIGKFTGHRVRYQCHGVFPSRLNGLGTILYYFRRGSAARALDAPQPLHRSESSLDIELDTNVMEYSRAGSTV